MVKLALTALLWSGSASAAFCHHLLERMEGGFDSTLAIASPFRPAGIPRTAAKLSVDAGFVIGKEATRIDIDLRDRGPLFALIKRVLDGAVEQVAYANGFAPFSHIVLSIYLDAQGLLLTFNDQANARKNPWDSQRRRTQMGDASVVPAVWKEIQALDLPYYFLYTPGLGNSFTIAIDWDLDVPAAPAPQPGVDG